MACTEHACIQQKCGWYRTDNESYKYCPDCDGPIRSYLDEDWSGTYDDLEDE